MRAMVLHKTSDAKFAPLKFEEVNPPEHKDDEVLVRVEACGVCRTDLHVVEGDLESKIPSVIPGHEIVGRVVETGKAVKTLSKGDLIGIPWLHETCGRCEYCVSGRENLCEYKIFTGYTVNGGYAEYVAAKEGYVFPLPSADPVQMAPLMCAGIIGYRALKLSLPRPGGSIGFFGFGGSAHLTLQLASKLGYETIAYSRSSTHLDLAKRLGAVKTILTGSSEDVVRPSLESAIVFAPVGQVVLQALKNVKKGGSISIAAIHMTNIPEIDYDRYLFGERKIMSVEANTRADAREFLDLSVRLGLRSSVSERKLQDANEALMELKSGKVDGALVLNCKIN